MSAITIPEIMSATLRVWDIAIDNFLAVFLKILADCDYERDGEKVYKLAESKKQKGEGSKQKTKAVSCLLPSACCLLSFHDPPTADNFIAPVKNRSLAGR